MTFRHLCPDCKKRTMHEFTTNAISDGKAFAEATCKECGKRTSFAYNLSQLVDHRVVRG